MYMRHISIAFYLDEYDHYAFKLKIDDYDHNELQVYIDSYGYDYHHVFVFRGKMCSRFRKLNPSTPKQRDIFHICYIYKMISWFQVV